MLKNKNEIIYVGDPMCSWCYGIANELDKLVGEYQNRAKFRIVMGGLRPHTQEPMDGETKKMIRHHWEEVNKRSGQPFKYDLLAEDTSFIYDTEKPCRAVVVVRNLKPESAFSFYKDVQSAFYAENMDTNIPGNYVSIAEKHGISSDEFLKGFSTEEIRKETYEDFVWAKQVGVTGFPTVIYKYEDTLYAVALGYNSFENMKKTIFNIENGIVTV
ncbi:DsbA family protein [Flexithrix dorotheae]|uniref:DsbA family protein n=1 Tax=Flexithrix dorotheae TaxID=70993 RepID=UPI00035C6386|nr:DsbA family protein [Flexithrix dorotheae]